MGDLEPSEIESAWLDEVERRVEEFDRGELSSFPAEDVFAEARRLVLRIDWERRVYWPP